MRFPVAICLLLLSTHLQAQEPAPPSEHLDEIKNLLLEINERDRETPASISDARQRAEVAIDLARDTQSRQTIIQSVGAVATFIIAVFGVLGYRFIRHEASKLAEKMVREKINEINNALDSNLNAVKHELESSQNAQSARIEEDLEEVKSALLGKLKDTGDSIERLNEDARKRIRSTQEFSAETLNRIGTQFKEELLDLSQVVILRHQERYEDALTAVGWDGDLTRFNNKPHVFRRALIECLAHTARKYKNEDGDYIAWEAATALLTTSPGIRNLELVLRTGVHLKKFSEAEEVFERYHGEIEFQEDTECHQLMLVVYRRLRKLDRALEMAEHIEEVANRSSSVRRATILKNIIYLNNHAALLRDRGHLERAHDKLSNQVRRITRLDRTQLPDGWHRLFNTYLANCIDLNRPDEGADAALFVVRMQYDSAHLFSCLRLALSLPHESRTQRILLERIRETVEQMPPSGNKAQIQAYLLDLDGQPSEAIGLLRSHAATLEEGESRSGRERYYIECTIGVLLVRNGETKQAIELLHKTAQKSNLYGGEASFRLAIAYAESNNQAEAARWLDRAIEETPKWHALARHENSLTRYPQISELLAERADLIDQPPNHAISNQEPKEKFPKARTG